MAAISFDPARKLTLYFRVARDGSRTLNFLDANGAAKDVSGHSFELNIKYRSSDTTNVIQFADGDFTKDSIDEITIPMTIALSTIASMEYYWELNVTLPDTSVHTWLTGNAIFHNGEFDGVTETTSITVDETSGGVTITINEGGSSSGTDADAIHKNVDDEFSTIPEKTTLSGNDLVLIEDSEDGNSKKKAKRSNVLGTSGSGDVVGPSGGVVDTELAVYNSTTGKIIKGSGGILANEVFRLNPSLVAVPMISDFMGTISPFDSANAGSGTAITFPSFSGEQGVARTQTGTTTTGRAYVGIQSITILETGLGQMTLQTKIKIDTLSDATDDYIIYLGFNDGTSAEPIDGMYFRYNHGVNSGNWQAITRTNSSETATNTGVAASTTAASFEIIVNAAGTSVGFYINGSLVATNTTNIPTGIRTYGIVNGVRKTVGTNSRIVDHFYLLFRNDLTTPR